MAHELQIKNGKAAMAYVGAKPWHGLGQELTAGASIDKWVKEAGMNFEILNAPVQYSDGTSTRVFPSRQILYRSDSGDALGFVSNSYQVVQPREILEFFRDLAEDHGFTLETAGVLFEGKKYWALARVPEELQMGRDKVRAHLMLATACDGSMSTTAKYVATRVVCNNTIQIASAERGGMVSRTKHNTSFKAGAVKEELEVFGAAWKETQTLIKQLNKRTVKAAEAVKYMIAVLGTPGVALEEQSNAPTIAQVLSRFSQQNYIGHEMSGATAWGLVNCVTEHVDHIRGRGADRRLDHAWFGVGADIKVRALEEAKVAFVS